MKPKPKQAMPVMLAHAIPTQKPIDSPVNRGGDRSAGCWPDSREAIGGRSSLYSRGDRIIANVVILLVSFGASFIIAKEVTWHVTGYIPPVRCGSVAAEFQRQVAEGAISWDTRQDSLSVVVGGQPGGSSPRGAARLEN